MCSISESNPTKKRQAPDHLDNQDEQAGEQSDNPLDDAQGSKKQKPMTSASGSDSFLNLLVQGLQSNDDKLINDVVNKKKSVIESTINNLPNAYVKPLFNFLQKALCEHGENVNYVVCLEILIQTKISQVLDIPNIRDNLKILSDTLDVRCDQLGKQKSQLDLVFSMLNKKKKLIHEEDIVINEESSGEKESSGGENSDEYASMMFRLEQQDEIGGKSFSMMTIDETSRCFEFDIMDLFDEQKESLSEMGVMLRPDDLDELNRALYKLNIGRIVSCGFPHALVLELDKRTYVDCLLHEIMFFIKMKFKIRRSRLKWACELKLPLQLGDQLKLIQLDFTMFESVKCIKKYFLVVECNGTCCDKAVIPLIGQLKSVFRLNNDGKTVYGLATNVTTFRLLSYNPADESAAETKGFKLSKTFTYLSFGMRKARDQWLESCTEIVQVIYSILCDKLAL